MLLLCREAGLVDDLTDHADVRAAFGAAAHRKAGRLGPAGRRQKEQQAQQQQQRVSVAAAAAVSSPERSRSVSPSGLPETLLFVPVSSKRPQRRSHSAATSRSPSPPPAGNAAVPAAAAAAAPPATLDARELLELLLLLVRDRHASLRRDPEALLRLLAARYVSRLRARRPDKGPPWLLRQALRPEVLAALEAAPGAPEALHAAYVHLSARGAPAASDLTLSLADARLGLKRTAAAAEDAAAGLEAGGGDRASPTGTGSSSSTAEQRRRQRQTEHQQQQQRQRRPQGLRLDRLAAFLRAAGLVPRVLAIYLGQLQRGSGGGGGGSSGGSSGGGPAAAPMPSLRLAAGGAAAGFDEQHPAGAEQQQRRRQQQQQQQQLAAVASWTAGRATSLGALVEEGNGTESVPASPGAEPHGALRSPFARGESKRLKRAVSFCGPADDAAAGVPSPTGSMLRRRPSMLNRRLSRDECVLY